MAGESWELPTFSRSNKASLRPRIDASEWAYLDNRHDRVLAPPSDLASCRKSRSDSLRSFFWAHDSLALARIAREANVRRRSGERGAIFLCDVEARVPAKHPLRAMRRVTDAALAELDRAFSALYEACGRPSVPPERLLRASLLQPLYSIRSERQLVERLEFDLLFRWFVGCQSTRRHSTRRPSPRTATSCSLTRSRKGFCFRSSVCRR